MLGDSRWDDLTGGECRLMHMDDYWAKLRLTTEIMMEIGAILYICAALREARFLGLNMFIENLVSLAEETLYIYGGLIVSFFCFMFLENR